MTDKKTGRPPKYDETQVNEAINIVETAGKIPDGETVKDAMCTHMGVSRGINAQSLDREVERLLEDRNRDRRERLAAALPAPTKAAAKQIGATIESLLLDHMADEHANLRSAAGKKLVEMKDDLNCQRAQIRGLLAQIDAKDSVLADLEGDKQDLERRLAVAIAEIASLTDRVSGLEMEQDFREKMLSLMKETLAQHPASAA